MEILTIRRAARLAGAGAPLAALLLGGCLREDVVQPVREAVAVHAMAVAGSTTFGVALSNISVLGAGRPISGATVRLLRGDATVTLVEVGSSSTYCFRPATDEPGFGGIVSAQCYAANLTEPIGARETLGLEIELNDGTVIRGATVTPALPEQVVPTGGEPVTVTFYLEGFANGFSIEPPTLEVRWHSVDDRPAQVLIEPRLIFRHGTGIEPGDCNFYFGVHSGPLSRSPGRVRLSTFCPGNTEDPVWDSAYVDLLVVAYDESYVRYAAAFHEDGTGVVLEHAAAGIELVSGNALVTGVFGSAAPVSVPLTLHAIVVDRRSVGGLGRTAVSALQADLDPDQRLPAAERERAGHLGREW